MLTKEQKREQFEQLRESLGGVTTLFLMRNDGLDVNEVNELRRKVREQEATYKVYKNSVVRLAIEGTSMEPIGEFLQGPNALAFTEGDGVALAKALKEFAKTHPALSFHRCFLEGQVLDSEQAVKVAEMPSREELLGRLVGMLQSPIRRLVVALNAPAQQLVSALNQVAEKQENTDS
jgi:large subunit ribosomal protein L10